MDIDRIEECFNVLRNYDGKNPYIFHLKKKALVDKKTLSDFEIEYIENNKEFTPIKINKNYKISDWLGEKLQSEYLIEFTPKLLKIIAVIGETKQHYHCYIQYRQSVNPFLYFVPKKAIWGNLFVKDFNDLDIDFSWFDNKLKEIDENFFVMDHQKSSIKFLLTNKKSILSLPPGLGKTLCSIVASMLDGENKKVLVICPASIKTNWKEELLRFVDEKDISLIKNVAEMNKSELLELLKLDEDCDIKVGELREMAKEKSGWKVGNRFTILNYDILDKFHKLPTSRRKDDIQKCIDESELIKSQFDIVIIDESHKLSDNTSNRFKIVKNYIKKSNIQTVWLLTGTMVTNNVKNLYNMLTLIDDDVTSDYEYFMKRYCGAKKILRKGEWERCWNMWSKGRYQSYAMLDRGMKEMFMSFVDKVGKKIMVDNGAENLDELNERIKHLYFRLDKENIIKDVKKNIIPIAYELTDEQKQRYNELWDEYAQKKIDEVGKDYSEMKQLLEVSVYRQYISKIMVENTINLANKLLSEGKKVFIVCCYDEELYELYKYFGEQSVIYNGKMNAKQKDAAKDAFNNDDNIRVFIGQIVACGVGLNLHKSCHNAIFQNLDFTDASFEQACDRIFRIGSKNDANIYLQYYKDTMSEHVVEIIMRKHDIAKKIITSNN